MSALIVIGDGRRYFWGSYASSSPNGILSHHIMMRREPMVLGRWYGNKKECIRLEKIDGQNGAKLAVITTQSRDPSKLGRGYVCLTFYEETFILFRNCEPTLPVHLQYAKQRVEEFYNRCHEYPHSYLVPLSKHNKLLNERWKAPINPQ